MAARPHRWLVPAALAICAAAPVLASAVHVGRGWVPVSDAAIVATRARDVFTVETPLLGQPSTAGIDVGEDVHHPGPLEYWVIAVAQRVHDGRATSLVAVVLVNLASAAAAVVLAWSAGGPSLAAAASAVVTGLGWSLRGEVLADPLNPSAALLPFAAFLVACVAAGARRRWAIVPAVVLGSYAAQAHLTIAAMVALAALGTVAGFAATTRHRGETTDRPASWRGPVVVALVLLAACWSAPLVDFVSRSGGNVAALAATSDARPPAEGALRRSLDKTTNALVPPIWLRSGADVPSLLARPSAVELGTTAALAGVAVLLGVLARRRREPAVVVAAAAALSLVGGGTLLFARFPTAFFNVFSLGNHLWLWPTSALLWSVAAAGIVALVGRRWVTLAAPGMATAGAVALGLASIIDPAAAPVDRGNPAMVRALSDELARTLPRDDTYLFDLSGEFEEQAVDTGIVHELVRRGFDVRVTPFFRPSYAWRTDEADVDAVLQVDVDRDRPTAEGTPVATFEPSRTASRRLANAEAAVVGRMEATGGLDDDLFPTFGKPVPESVDAFVKGDFLTMAAAGFLGETARWPETRALAAARRQPVRRAAVFLRRPTADQAAWTAMPATSEATVAAAGVRCSTTVGYTCQWTR